MVAANAADSRLRDGLARVRRHLRRLRRDREEGRELKEAGASAELEDHRGNGRRRGGDRLHEAAPGREQHRRGSAPDRNRRTGRRRRQQLDGDGAVAAVRAAIGTIMVVDPAMEAEQVDKLKAWRANRDAKKPSTPRWPSSSAPPRKAATSWSRRLPPRKAGVTTGEWGGAAQDFRRVPRSDRRRAGRRRSATARSSRAVRESVETVSDKLGRRIKFLVGKPGLDGHSNGAEQIAVRARDCRHGGRLRGHPPDAGADRARRCR